MSDDTKPIAFDAYEKLADFFAAESDTKPHNAYYDRPAVVGLLPDVQGKNVLDAGCGSGWYTAWLLERGARVTGIDMSPKMIEHTRQRTNGRVTLHQADLSQPLDFLPDAAFDLVVSGLAIHYVSDLPGLLGEFHRVLRTGGLLVFSTGHPIDELRFSAHGNYFETELVSATWRKLSIEPVEVPWYRMPLSAFTEGLWQAGFVIERLVEPRPTPEFKQADPEDYEKLMHMPAFMCIRARKEDRQ